MKYKEKIFVGFMFVMIILATLIECIDISKDKTDEKTNGEYSEASEENLITENYVDSDDIILDDSIDSGTLLDETDIDEVIAVENKIDLRAFTGIAYDTADAIREEKIDAIIASMTVEEKVGQMFFIKNDGRFKENLLETIPAGGIILFAGDIKGLSRNLFTEKIQKFQAASAYPLFIGTDEEGGIVNRVSVYSTYAMYPFKSSKDLYNQGGFDAIREDTIEKSDLLLSIGINVNFAPVCDVAPNKTDYMYSRSFSGDPNETAEYIDLVVSIMNEKKIGSVMKHFPGYGSNGDTHKAEVKDERPLDDFKNCDFLPFESGIKAGGDCILVSHNIVTCMDAELPASISPTVHRVIREGLGFNGVIITDDLMMSGVEQYASREELAIMAVEAGNDMLLSTYYEEQYNAVLDAVKNGDISINRIEQSVRRIIRWKMKLGLM